LETGAQAHTKISSAPAEVSYWRFFFCLHFGACCPLPATRTASCFFPISSVRAFEGHGCAGPAGSIFFLSKSENVFASLSLSLSPPFGRRGCKDPREDIATALDCETHQRKRGWHHSFLLDSRCVRASRFLPSLLFVRFISLSPCSQPLCF
jgi:hypothetical protein